MLHPSSQNETQLPVRHGGSSLSFSLATFLSLDLDLSLPSNPSSRFYIHPLFHCVALPSAYRLLPIRRLAAEREMADRGFVRRETLCTRTRSRTFSQFTHGYIYTGDTHTHRYVESDYVGLLGDVLSLAASKCVRSSAVLVIFKFVVPLFQQCFSSNSLSDPVHATRIDKRVNTTYAVLRVENSCFVRRKPWGSIAVRETVEHEPCCARCLLR